MSVLPPPPPLTDKVKVWVADWQQFSGLGQPVRVGERVGWALAWRAANEAWGREAVGAAWPEQGLRLPLAAAFEGDPFELLHRYGSGALHVYVPASEQRPDPELVVGVPSADWHSDGTSPEPVLTTGTVAGLHGVWLRYEGAGVRRRRCLVGGDSWHLPSFRMEVRAQHPRLA